MCRVLSKLTVIQLNLQCTLLLMRLGLTYCNTCKANGHAFLAKSGEKGGGRGKREL